MTDIDLSEIRVVARAKEGGHYVDPLTLASNYHGNLEKLDKYFSIFDSVTPNKLPQWFIKGLPEITAAVINCNP